MDHALVLMAWCCLREWFRKFRVDRIATAETTGDRRQLSSSSGIAAAGLPGGDVEVAGCPERETDGSQDFPPGTSARR
nr:hypothetical protein [Roseateles chitosanitabidus]